MPSKSSRFHEIDTFDPYYETAMAGVAGHLQTLSMSRTFEDAVGQEEADELSQFAELLRFSFASPSLETREKAFTQLYDLPAYLKKTCPDGKTYLDKLKDAAEKDPRGLGAAALYDDLALLDSKLRMGLDLPPLKKAEPKKGADKTWREYTRMHLTDVPHAPEKKAEYLSKAMVGAVLAARNVVAPKGEAMPFELETARDTAKQLQKLPVFQQLCKNPTKVRQLLAAGKEDQGKLVLAAGQIQRPFSQCSKEQCRSILEKLKQMEPMMDSPQGRSEKWERFRESIRTIDLNDPENSGEKKLQEILDKTVDYTKGKKSLRRKQADQNCFDQSLDVLSVLAEGGEYARLAAQAVVDRTNEVRLGHDKDYNKISLKGYGLKHIAEHTNVKDRETLKAFENSFVRPKGTLKRTGFQVKREDDPSALEPVPKGLKTGAYTLKDAMWDCEKLASGETLSEFEAKGDVAAALALAETQVYYRASHGGKKKGIILSANHLVIDAEAYTQKKIALLSDPALEQLAKKYQDPEARKALFPPASPPKKHEPKGVGEAPAPEDPRGEVSYRPDIRSLKIEKLQEELAEIRRTMEQPEAAPAL